MEKIRAAIPLFCLWLFLTGVFPSPGTAQESPHGEISIPCEKCHTANSWKELRAPMAFDHASTGFALTGRHAAAACRTCHVSLKFRDVTALCRNCHEDVHHGELGALCERCHSPQSWLIPDMAERHTQTRFPLLGAHRIASCRDCHVSQERNQYRGTSTDCYACHRQQYEATLAPAHAQAGFGTDCVACHAVDGLRWGGNFNHASTGFPLTGAHAAIACASCHKGSTFKGAPTECMQCHQGDYSATRNPAHSAAGFSTACATCHSMTAWRPATFDHNATAFPLTGAHARVACNECHKNNQYKGTPTQCAQCHQGEFTATTNPAHVSGGFPTTCVTCHTTMGWQPASFDHNASSFPLTGAHVAVSCVTCHTNNQFTGTPTLCYQCHQGAFNATTSPAHLVGGFPTACVTCHTTGAWRPSTFSHSTTAFPLTGAHAAADCNSCHKNNVFKGTPTDCLQCHQVDYNASTNPAHAAAGFPTACVTCHTTAGWRPSTFNHSTTAFPLTGAHAAVLCNSCHKNNVFKGTPTDCVQCHQGDYNASTNPAHAAAGFPTACVTCHTTAGWRPSTFNHSTTAFPLTGAHAAVACNSCHINNVFKGTPTQCVQCHQNDYNGTTNPAHAAAGIPTTCVTCHSTSAWQPASFDHSTTGFPLTGAHTTVTCASCHVSGYSNTSTQCYSCHQKDYAASVNPPHATQGYPTDCQPCHSTAAWRPSTFQHDTFFPISAGTRHPPGRWTTCADCHQVAGNFQAFSCINCHAHIQSTMDPKHTGVPNYQFNSQACYTCHPRGNS